jgi:DNA primase
MSLQQLREKIVNEIPISELIQRYGVHLTRKPSGHVGVCPFHNDSNPSMSVSDDKRIYKCFACGAGTTHFDFVMNLNNLDFVDALKDICEKFGIDFDSYTNKKEKSQKLVYAEKIVKAASEIYYQTGQKARPQAFLNFLKNRNLSEKIVEDYKLGYAPKANSILDYIKTLPAKTQKEVHEVALEIGLVKYNDQNKSHYDTFRDRIVFPVWDHYGKIIGFQSRAVHDYQKPKYLNSKESFLFNKRNLLYGLHLAKSFIRKRDMVLVCEGNMDQIATYKKGFENSVAIMGTALGDNSLRMLKSLTNNIILSLDSDQAGFDAAVRINKQFITHGILPKYIEFTPHKDPDDFLEAEGGIAFQEKIDNAKPFIDIQFESLCPEHMPEILDQKLDLLQKAFEIVAPLKKDLRATERIVKWAEKLGLQSSSEKILENYEQFLDSDSKNISSSNFSQPVPPIEEEEIPIEDTAIEMPTRNEIGKTEETFIFAIIEHPEILEQDKLPELLDFMGSDKVKEYILVLKNLVYEIDEKEFKHFALLKSQDFGLEEIVSKAVNKFQTSSLEKEKAEKLLSDLKLKLTKEDLKEKKAFLKMKRDNCTTEQELTSLMVEIHNIDKQLYNLK